MDNDIIEIGNGLPDSVFKELYSGMRIINPGVSVDFDIHLNQIVNADFPDPYAMRIGYTVDFPRLLEYCII